MHDLLPRFTVGNRLTAGFALLLAQTLAIAAIGILSLGRLTAQLDSLAQQRDRSTALAYELYDRANLIQINLQTLVYAPDDATRQRLQQAIQASRATVSSTLDALDTLSTDAQARPWWPLCAHTAAPPAISTAGLPSCCWQTSTPRPRP